jgi:hypothetical protein
VADQVEPDKTGKELAQEILNDAYRMSAADLSVLEAAARDESAHLITTEGSANDRLWSKMARVDWMRAAAVPSELGALMPAMRTYQLTPKGRRKIPMMFELFKLLKITLDLQKAHEEMKKKLDELMADWPGAAGKA